MPRPTQKVARGRALRADGRKLFTKLVDSDDENSSIESDWEDDNDVSDSDSSQDAHQTMHNLFSRSLQRHQRSKTSVHHPTVCWYLISSNFITYQPGKVKKQKVMRASVYTGDSYWTDLRRHKAQQELAEAAEGMPAITSFFSVCDSSPVVIKHVLTHK